MIWQYIDMLLHLYTINTTDVGTISDGRYKIFIYDNCQEASCTSLHQRHSAGCYSTENDFLLLKACVMVPRLSDWQKFA